MPLPIREEELGQITKKVYALYARYGCEGISMDEISRQTKISKATLYRYFTSKEDIIRGMVDYMIHHLNSVRFTKVEGIYDIMTDLGEFYQKSVLITALSGSRFLKDLQNKFPDCYRSYREAMNAMQERFSQFYKKGVEKGVFRDFPLPLVNDQFRNMLPLIADMNYLEQNGLSLADALREYYRMFACQILTKDYLFVVDQAETAAFIDSLTDILLNDFFIDSIRR